MIADWLYNWLIAPWTLKERFTHYSLWVRGGKEIMRFVTKREAKQYIRGYGLTCVLIEVVAWTQWEPGMDKLHQWKESKSAIEYEMGVRV